MVAFTTFPCSFRQLARSSPATCSITQALPPATSQTLLSIANTTTGTGYRGMLLKRIRPTITPPLRRHFILLMCSHLRISAHQAAETLRRLGPTRWGESGSLVEQATHFLLHMASNVQVF